MEHRYDSVQVDFADGGSGDVEVHAYALHLQAVAKSLCRPTKPGSDNKCVHIFHDFVQCRHYGIIYVYLRRHCSNECLRTRLTFLFSFLVQRVKRCNWGIPTFAHFIYYCGFVAGRRAPPSSRNCNSGAVARRDLTRSCAAIQSARARVGSDCSDTCWGREEIKET